LRWLQRHVNKPSWRAKVSSCHDVSEAALRNERTNAPCSLLSAAFFSSTSTAPSPFTAAFDIPSARAVGIRQGGGMREEPVMTGHSKAARQPGSHPPSLSTFNFMANQLKQPTRCPAHKPNARHSPNSPTEPRLKPSPVV